MQREITNTLYKVVKAILKISLILILGGSGIWAYENYMYPFGHRYCTLQCMDGALLTYAAQHHGNFPYSEKGPYDAIQKLFPEYTPSGIELAGISGDENRVIKVLHEGGKLDRTITSWVYVPGLKQDDDPQLAILWEFRGGINSDGRRNPSGGHAVLLVGGAITNVSGLEWNNFLERQKILRKGIASETTITEGSLPQNVNRTSQP